MTSYPVGNVEVRVSEPSITISERAAPFTFGHMVVQMDINSLLRTFLSYRVENLGMVSDVFSEIQLSDKD